MSLLNRASHGNHSILVAIFKLLSIEKKRLTRDNIINLCAPSETGDKEKVRQTINAWVTLGLLEQGDDYIFLNDSILPKERSIESLPDLCRRFLLLPKNNEDLWAKEEARASEFVRSMSWVMSQDVWDVSMDGWEELQSLIQEQLGLGSNSILQNSVNWKGLKEWAIYLGFAWRPVTSKSEIVVDPTEAIRSILSKVFNNRKTLSGTELITGLASEIPILDSGKYRMQVEERMLKRQGAMPWSPPPTNQVSTSLSRSILRLTLDETLNGVNKADDNESKRITLTGRNLSKLKQFSEFTKA